MKTSKESFDISEARPKLDEKEIYSPSKFFEQRNVNAIS
jgi:hypothetical protein